jgi:hypothetical protein
MDVKGQVLVDLHGKRQNNFALHQVLNFFFEGPQEIIRRAVYHFLEGRNNIPET